MKNFYLFTSLFLFVFLNTTAFGQIPDNNNDPKDDDNSDNLFAIVVRGDVKPDSLNIEEWTPPCIDFSDPSFSKVGFEIGLFNLDKSPLPCDLFIQLEFNENKIQSDLLTFTCEENYFCQECPNTPMSFCTAEIEFNFSPEMFEELCIGNETLTKKVYFNWGIYYDCEMGDPKNDRRNQFVITSSDSCEDWFWFPPCMDIESGYAEGSFEHCVNCPEGDTIESNNGRSQSEGRSNEEIKLYPIPASNNIEIYISDNIKDFAIDRIVDAFGQTYKMDGRLKLNRLDISDLPSGLYYLLISTEDGLITKALIKN